MQNLTNHLENYSSKSSSNQSSKSISQTQHIKHQISKFPQQSKKNPRKNQLEQTHTPKINRSTNAGESFQNSFMSYTPNKTQIYLSKSLKKTNHWNNTIPLSSPKRTKFDSQNPPPEPELDEEDIDFIREEGERCLQTSPVRYATLSDLDFVNSFLSYRISPTKAQTPPIKFRSKSKD